jgi:hypothetical protein
VLVLETKYINVVHAIKSGCVQSIVERENDFHAVYDIIRLQKYSKIMTYASFWYSFLAGMQYF